MTQNEIFGTLSHISVNDRKEKKNGLDYLSWTWAWAGVKEIFPTATYKVLKFDGVPYKSTPLGIMCYTEVTIEGLTHEMWLPVMDSSNKAMKETPYTYKVWNGKKSAWEDRIVAAATMFDINKTIMRCLTKNLAIFGFGISLYTGEDLPEQISETEPTPAPAPVPQKPAITNPDMIAVAKDLASAKIAGDEKAFNAIKESVKAQFKVSKATWEKIGEMMKEEISKREQF